MPTSVYAATADFADPGLRSRIDRAADELAREIGRRPPATVADPFALTTSFEDLLSG